MKFETRSLFVLVVAAVLMSSRVASATDPEVEARFKKGVELFKEADFRAALVEFRRAYDKSKNPKILYNIAKTEFQLTDYVAAIATYERYLTEATSVIDKARRAEVEEELPRLRARVATATITTSVPGATVTIDDEVVGTSPLASPVLLNPGGHRIVVRKEGFVESSRRIEVAGGDFPAVDLRLTEQPAVRKSSDTAPESSGAGSTLRTTGIIVGAAGLVAIGFGTGFGLSAKSKNDEAAGMCTGIECRDPRALSLTEDARSAATVSTIGFVAGGVLLASGVGLFLFAPKAESKTAVRLAPRVGPQSAFLSLGGSFQ
ncbi:MAG: TonB-dependent receptor [Labilithrix sp.]|nr:TonB-dependent receptor [Labilithrix sp.]